MDRRSVCFPRPGTHDVLQSGDPGFERELARLYSNAENHALRSLIGLKAHLHDVPTDDFWSAVTEGLASILDADMTFVVKRVLIDDKDAAVEMPPLGEPGACMMAAAFHYRGRDGTKNTIKQSKFHAWGCPCAYMRHDKVFVCADGLHEYVANNPNDLPTAPDAYIALPLFADGRCFAHFGAMWSKEGAALRTLSWGFTEMLLHSLEDMIRNRFLEDRSPRQPATASHGKQRVIPHEDVTVAQSLRPYAPSLSHELRTPMQGVVGMLDVMHATVQEAVDAQADSELRQIFQSLKENIEVVQDSSRRAVEAADNFVHAADMDLTVPELAPLLVQDDSFESASPISPGSVDRRPDILVAGSNLPISRPNKRRRDDEVSCPSNGATDAKVPRLKGAVSVWSHASDSNYDGSKTPRQARQVHVPAGNAAGLAPAVEDAELANGHAVPDASSRLIAPGLRHTSLREVFQHVINEGLKMGGRPDSALAQETENGEIVEVRSRGSDGTASSKIIEWSVDPAVPQTMFTDEKDLTKLISCLFLNAVKFTNHHDGRVKCSAKMSQRGRYISIKISDNGPGISSAFLPRLFKPFSQGDGTITRPSEGLGLGLLVAKGIARKLGGDLMCTKATTEGPDHGSEFEVKVPVIAGETITRPSSPYDSPLPRRAPSSQPDSPQLVPLSQPPSSPPTGAKALPELPNDTVLLGDQGLVESPSSSPRTDTQIDSASPVPHKPPKSTPSPPPTDPPVPSPPSTARPRMHKSVSNPEIDRDLAEKYPLTFLVVEDNKIIRKLLVTMLRKFGYKNIHEAHDGAEAVRQMTLNRASARCSEAKQIDVILMDLWMPLMDGYEATKRILSMGDGRPTVLAVTADVTDGAAERAAQVGMKGLMTKPYKLADLQRLITEYCARTDVENAVPATLPTGIAA